MEIGENMSEVNNQKGTTMEELYNGPKQEPIKDDGLKICITWQKTVGSNTFKPGYTLKILLVDMHKGLIKSEVTTVDLTKITDDYTKQKELVETLVAGNTDIVFDFNEFLKLGRPINDPVFDTVLKVLQKNTPVDPSK